MLSIQLLNAASKELYTGDLCENIGLVLAYLPSGAMSLHHLAIMTQSSLSCLLCFLCMLDPKFEDF